MSRNETQIVKGVAILMMLWLHLFFDHLSDDIASRCTNLVYIGGLPLSHLLAKACRPVDMFLILGGYGLYCVYLKGNDKRRFSRIFKLFVHYWIVLALFVPVEYYFSPKGISLSPLSHSLKNISAIRTIWDGPCWFLLPYSILSFFYPLLFRLIDKYKITVSLGVLIMISVIQYQVYVHHSLYIKNHSLLFLLNNTIGYVLPFMIGALLKKYNVFEKLKTIRGSKEWHSYLFMGAFILTIVLKCSLSTSYLSTYELLFVLLFVVISRPTWFDTLLAFFGKHSMNIWMIHYMIYFYFDSYLYCLEYPIFIWGGLVAVSIVFSYLVNFVSKQIGQILPIKY